MFTNAGANNTNVDFFSRRFEKMFVCLFVCLGVNKASQEGALQRHPGIELSLNIPMYGGYDLGCHRGFPFNLRMDFHPFSRARITEGCVAKVLKSLSSWRRAGRRVFRFGKIVWDTGVLKGCTL